MVAGNGLFNNGVVVAGLWVQGTVSLTTVLLLQVYGFRVCIGLSNNGVVVAGLWVQGMVSLTTMLLLQVYRFRVRSL